MNIERLHRRIFERVSRHLLTQKEPALRNGVAGNPCMYHADDGKRCAIGCLISTARYHPGLENRPAYDPPVLSAVFPRNWRKVPTITQRFMRRLQNIHDAYPPTSWFRALTEIAEEHGFPAPVAP